MTKTSRKHGHEIGKAITLREIEKSDLEMLRLWRNANKEFFFTQTEITPEKQKDWYKNHYLNNPNDTIYMVSYRGKPVGTLAMIKQGDDYEIGRVMLGEKEYARHGVMGAATEKLLDKYKTSGDTQRVFLEVIKTNIPAIKFYELHGFKKVSANIHGFVMERFV